MKPRIQLQAGRFAFWALWACLAGSPFPVRASEALADSPADRLYSRACGHVERGHLDLAYDLLKEAFLNGLAHPMKVATDSRLAPLLADSAWRPRVRDLIHRHAWDEEAVMAAPAQKAERVVIQIRILDESGAPVPRAVVDLWQGDENFPCALEGDWNPFLFASLRSGDSGQVMAETTLPNPSGHVHGVPPTRHLHLAVERTGFDVLRGIVILEEGSTKDGSSGEPGTWVAHAGPKISGKRTFEAELRLSRTP